MPGETSALFIAIPDVNGALRGKALSRMEARRALQRGFVPLTDLLLALDPSDQPISTIEEVGITAGSPDLLVRPLSDALGLLTWMPGWSMCIGSVSCPDGTPCFLASRTILETALQSTSKAGLEVQAGLEYEIRLKSA
jgi:glutamine synthetase